MCGFKEYTNKYTDVCTCDADAAAKGGEIDGSSSYSQINSSMSVKSFLSQRPVLSAFSMATEKGRLASRPPPGSATGLRESQPWPGSQL